MAQANSGDFKTPECRLAFSAGLWEPTSQGAQGGDPKYGCTLIYENKDRGVLEQAVQKVIGLKWGPKGLQDFKAGLIKNPIFEGTAPQAHNKQDGKLWSGFGPGVCFIRCKNNDDAAPKVLFQSKLVEATKEEVYSGCYGRAVLNAYSWEHPTGGRGVTFNIRIFKKTRDGESLGGRVPVDVDKWFIDTEFSNDSAVADEGAPAESVVNIFE